MNYCEKNKKHNNEISKLYRKNNLPFVKRQQRIWYIKTKEYIICSCGLSILKHNEKNHLKTLKHSGVIKPKKEKKQKEEKKTVIVKGKTSKKKSFY